MRLFLHFHVSVFICQGLHSRLRYRLTLYLTLSRCSYFVAVLVFFPEPVDAVFSLPYPDCVVFCVNFPVLIHGPCPQSSSLLYPCHSPCLCLACAHVCVFIFNSVVVFSFVFVIAIAFSLSLILSLCLSYLHHCLPLSVVLSLSVPFNCLCHYFVLVLVIIIFMVYFFS